MTQKKASLFFLGIGGIGMSALARYFDREGYDVSGYDRTATALTKALEDEGITIQYNDEITEAAVTADRVVYTPAIPEKSVLRHYFIERKKPMYKRAAVLGELAKPYHTIAIAGTHGKTTISSLVTHILKHARLPVTAFVGGIMKNYGTNYLASDEKKYLVLEADEFDRSFLNIFADTAVISAVDADHLDIYASHHDMLNAFGAFIKQIRPGGILITKANISQTIPTEKTTVTYANEENADYFSSNLHASAGAYTFNINYPEGRFEDITLPLPGIHNVENATAAIAVAHSLGVDVETIASALQSFQGIHRRFVTAYSSENLVVIDDYAHHPKELEVVLFSAREMYPGYTVKVLFQPHLFSRTRDFMDGFQKSLSLADEVYLLDIYPAREEPIEGITSAALLKNIDCQNKALLQKDEATSKAWHQQGDKPTVLLILGAGDISQLVEPIVNQSSTY